MHNSPHHLTCYELLYIHIAWVVDRVAELMDLLKLDLNTSSNGVELRAVPLQGHNKLGLSMDDQLRMASVVGRGQVTRLTLNQELANEQAIHARLRDVLRISDGCVPP